MQYHSYNNGPPPPGASRKGKSHTGGVADHVVNAFGPESITEKVMSEVGKAYKRLRGKMVLWYRETGGEDRKAFLKEFLTWGDGFLSSYADMVKSGRWRYSPNEQLAYQYRREIKDFIERFKGKGGDTRDFAKLRHQLREEHAADRRASQWNWLVKGGVLVLGAWAISDLVSAIKAE